MAVPATFLNIFLLTFLIVNFFNNTDYYWTLLNAALFASVMSVIDYTGNLNISKKIDGL
jgi:hypothetical protein